MNKRAALLTLRDVGLTALYIVAIVVLAFINPWLLMALVIAIAVMIIIYVIYRGHVNEVTGGKCP